MAKKAKITKKYINKKSQAKFLVDSLDTNMVGAMDIHFNSHHPDELRGKAGKKFAKAAKHWKAYMEQLNEDYGKDDNTSKGN